MNKNIVNINSFGCELKIKLNEFEIDPNVWNFHSVLDCNRKLKYGINKSVYSYEDVPFFYDNKDLYNDEKYSELNGIIENIDGLIGVICNEYYDYFLLRLCISNGVSLTDFLEKLNEAVTTLCDEDYFVDLEDVKSDNLEQEFCAVITIGVKKE